MHLIPLNSSHSTKFLLLRLIGFIFIGEMISHSIIEMLPPLSHFHMALLDASLLLALIFPAIYALAFRPLKIQEAKHEQAEMLRQQAQDRLTKVAGQVPGVVFQFQLRPDGSCCLPYANEQLLNIYRVAPEAVRDDAAYVFTVVHPDDLEAHLAAIQTSARDLTPWFDEYRLKFGDEPDCWLLGNALPQRLDDGSTLWHGFITDITARKRIEHELQRATDKLQDHHAELEAQNHELQQAHIQLEESRNRYMDLFDFAPIGYLTLTGDGLIEKINHTGAQLLCGERTALQRRSLNYFLEAQECERWQQHFLSALTLNTKQSFELVMRRDDGNDFHALLDCQRMENSEPAMIHVAFTDISERKQAEIELQIAATAFESQEGMVITDTDNVIVKVNHAFARLTGYSCEELLNRRMNILKSGHHDAEFYNEMWGSLIRKGAWQGEIWNRLKNGEVHPTFVTITAVRNKDGQVINYVATYTDITERKITEDKVNNLAFYDQLTQLPNRVLFADRIKQTLALCRRNREIAAVCMLDLDGFKHVNDTLGHAAGDQLLWEVAQRLKDCIRQEDTAARFGGDEFALLLGGFARVSECEQTLARIVTVIAAPYLIFGQLAHISASIGVTLFPEDNSEPDLLLRHADQAMYQVKQASKNGYQLFNAVYEKRNQTNQDSLARISDALAQGQFELYYQPEVDCRQGKVVGAEALLRWNHPVLGVLSSAEFIPVIEHDDLMITLDSWSLQHALRQLKGWHEAGFNIKVSVNISARQLLNPEFPARLQAILSGYNAEIIQYLAIEVIESAVLKDVLMAGDVMRQCRAMGVGIILDDFGSGFSALVQSLVRLNHFSVDALKVDLGFVSDLLGNSEEMAIVEGVVGLAASCHAQVIAKGVGHIDQILMLMELGCDVMQGGVLTKPMSAKHMDSWLAVFIPDPLWGAAAHLTSRDYFELLLTEAKHRCWINRVIANLDDPDSVATPELLQDHRQSHFGHWYREERASHFRNTSEFHELDAIHRDIYQTTAHLCEHRQAGMTVEADADTLQLLAQQHTMSGLVHRLLADELLKQQNS
ncbi:MAG: EAL domain-containing protein [Methylobacter sp.]|nr:EAL domain-containing protein [Methylobacter sp.]